MMAEPLLSIVIPTYNRAGHIARTIQSALDQRLNAHEIIIIDDGSTDNTEAVVAPFVSGQLVYIKRTNSERGASRNAGTRIARGRYVMFLDSDDLLLPNHVETVYDLTSRYSGQNVFALSYIVDLGEQKRQVILSNDINTKLGSGNLLSCNGVVIERQTALQNPFSEDRDLSGVEDWELWLRLASKQAIVSCPVITSVIIQHDDRSVMQTTPDKIEKRFAAFYRHLESNPELMQYYARQKRKLYSSCETYMALHLALTRIYGSAAMGHLWKGIKWSPSCIFTRRFLAIMKHLW